MSNLATTFSNLELSAETDELFKEALAEFEVCQRDAAKSVIKQRLLEIKRMEACLEKAKADLAKLLNRNIEEILMLEA
jgi:hypothetical protein